MKVVCDTDVVVAGLRNPSGASRAWLRAILEGQVACLLSVPLVLQYEEVLLRDERLAAIPATAADVGAILDALCRVCRPVEIHYTWRPSLRDADDEMVLEAAVHGGADWILTFNERDFAGAERFAPRVGRPGPVWRRWQGERR